MPREKYGRNTFGLVFVLLATGIVSTGSFAYRHYEARYRFEVERTLSAVAELKVRQLVEYRNERLADGRLLFKNAALTALVRRFFEQPDDTDAQRQLQDWMGKFQANYQYDQARLLDAQGVTRLRVPGQAEPVSRVLAQRVPEILRQGEVVLEDFFRDDRNQRVYLAVMIPILDETSGGQPLGVLALRIDPATYLYPFLNLWPTPSETAETLLVRREGNDALFLNELRFATNTPLNRRVSLARQEVPAARAAQGHEGIMDGVDYRGNRVVARLRAVPGSPWFLVARMDTEELYGPLRDRLWMMIGTVAALLLGAGSGLGWLWWQQSARFFRKQYEAAQALQASEDRFRLVMEATREGVWDWDIPTGTVYYSPACLVILGFRREEFPAQVQSWRDLIHPEDLPQVVRANQDCLEHRCEEFHFESRMRTRQGDWRWILTRGKCVSRDPQGRALRLVGTHVDITDRRRMEEAVRESEAHFRDLFENSPDAVFVEDAGGTVLDVNPAACRLHGLSRDELLGKNVLDLVPSGSREKVRSQFPQWFRGGLTACEGVSYRADGQVVAVDISGTTIRYRGQTVALLHVRDVTERKRMEEALRVSEVAFRLVLEHSNDAIFWANAETGIIIRCNRKTEALTERTRDELIGLHVENLHPPGRDYREIFRRLAAVPSTENVETEFLSQTGKRTPVVVNFTVVTIGREKIVQGIGRDITERKRAEDALRLAEEQRRLALAAGNLGTWDHNLVTGAAFWDERCRAIFGVPAGEPVDQATTLALMHEADRPCMEGVMRDALRPEGGGTYEAEYRVVRPDGSVRWVAASGQAYFQGEGELRKPVRLVGIVSDITNRKQSEEALRQSEAEFRLVLEHSNDAIFWADAETGILVRCNRKAEELTGRTRDELIGMHQRQLHPRDAGYTELFRKAAGVPSAENIQAEVLSRTGKRTPVLVNSSVITVGRRRILQGIFRDITERKHAEEALRRARDELEVRVQERTTELRQINQQLREEIEVRRRTEEELKAAEFRYRTVANFTHDWEYWETPEYVLNYCSPSCAEITGYAAEEFIADPRLLQRIVHPEDTAIWLNHRQEELTAQGTSSAQFRIRRKDGGIRWLEHIGQPVVGTDGRFLGIRASNRDITDRKQQELQTQRLREELGHVTRVSTAGQLAAALSHELRQPLTAISCNIQAAERFLATGQPDLAEVTEALRDIRSDSKRASGVVHGLSAMFRKNLPQHAAVRLNDIIQETTDLLRSEFVLKETTVQLELEPELPCALGNRIELQQVVVNLIVNALEAMAERPPSSRNLHVRADRESPGMLRASFRDSGTGIPEPHLSRLFESFFTTKPGGMGMGLAICQSIIGAHGGRLWAVNNPDQGATFHFTLPIRDEEHASPAPRTTTFL